MIAKTSGPFATRPAGHFARLDVSNEDYHRSADGISNSMLSVFLDDPALFEGRYLSRRYPAPPQSPEFAFGSLAHAVILEDGLDNIVEIPRDVLAKDGSRRGAEWHKFVMENEGRSILKPEEIFPLREIRRNCEQHPVAGPLLYETDGVNETSIEWTDEETGLLLRSRMDRWTTAGKWPAVIVDVKTCQRNDPESFSRSAFTYGYHRQAAFYRRGVNMFLGEALPFVIIAVRKTPPFSVSCYELSESFLELGEREISEALSGIRQRRDCRDPGAWQSESSRKILYLDPPRWAFNNDWEVTT